MILLIYLLIYLMMGIMKIVTLLTHQRILHDLMVSELGRPWKELRLAGLQRCWIAMLDAYIQAEMFRSND